MKKAVIITSCGLILALIIGAVSYQLSSPSPEQKNNFFIAPSKCIDATPKNNAPTCGTRSEKFLREVRHKARTLYA